MRHAFAGTEKYTTLNCGTGISIETIKVKRNYNNKSKKMIKEGEIRNSASD
jgi:hypothetical protein